MNFIKFDMFLYLSLVSRCLDVKQKHNEFLNIALFQKKIDIKKSFEIKKNGPKTKQKNHLK